MSHSRQLTRAVLCLIVLCLMSSIALAAGVAEDQYWSDQFIRPDYTGNVYTAVEYQGNLVVCGQFTDFAGAPVTNVVAFDGADWHSMNFNPSHSDDKVYAAIVWQGTLVVAGGFYRLDGVTVNNVASFDGSAWHPIGHGVPGGAFALAAYNDDLYVGGEFGLMKWNGNDWQSIADDMEVRSLVVRDGNLVLGGSVRIAEWDGVNLTSIGTIPDYAVKAMTVYNTDLIVAGSFAEIGGVAAARVARWDGAMWHSMGDGLPGDVNRLVAYDGQVFAAGDFEDYVVGRSLMVWDGTSWTELTSDIRGNGDGLFVYDNKLIITDTYIEPGTGEAYHLTAWDGGSFEPLPTASGLGVGGSVKALSTIGDTLLVGGSFSEAGRVPCPNVALYDGTEWQYLGVSANDITAFEYYNGEIIVGGYDWLMQGDAYGEEWCVARWTGTELVPLDSSLVADHSQSVYDMLVYDDDLYIAGGMFHIDGDSVGHLVKWNGSQTIGVDIPEHMWWLRTLAVFEGDLVIGGYVWPPDLEPRNHVYRLVDGEWEPMGEIVHGDVNDLVAYDGELWVCGSFAEIGSTTVNYIPKWNGQSWVDVGGAENLVRQMTVFGDNLFAVGAFEYIGGVTCNRVAKLDGEYWQPLGSGLTGDGYTVAVYDGQLAVGGGFHRAGEKPARSLSMWSGRGLCCAGMTGNLDGDQSDAVTLGDLTVMVDHLFLSLRPPECIEEANTDGSADGAVTLADLTALIDHLFISLSDLAPCE
ncbi:hypothetical protein GF377_04795 [candidate division GN15 bacterium]|nr:hypothetical protein [candidate division GN15 bacterium]